MLKSLSRIYFGILTAFLPFVSGLFAQPCSLDSTFDAGLNPGAVIYIVTVQTNGQILIGGSFESVGGVRITNVARLNTNGTLDTSFSPGAAANRGYVNAIAVQPDGKIVLGGAFYSSIGIAPANLARLNANGSVDQNFDNNLLVDDAVNSIVIQPDGLILFGGAFAVVNELQRRSVARLNADGTLDITFDACVASTAGVGATWLGLQSDGRIIATGIFAFANGEYRYGLARLGLCGDVDLSYAPQQPGIDFDTTAYTFVMRHDERVVLAGSFSTYNGVFSRGVARVTTNGLPDSSFSPGDGINAGGTTYALAMQHDGKLVIAGDFTGYDQQTRYRIARINADGALDTGCDAGGGPDAAVSSLAIQRDGKILVAGRFSTFNGLPRVGLARLNGDHRLAEAQRLADGRFQMNFYGDNGVSYSLESSSNLVDWISISNFTATTSPKPLIDSSAASNPKQFYRAVYTP